MPKRRTYLVAQAIRLSEREDFAPDQEATFAACPEAARFSDEEAEDFWAAALFFDQVNPREIARGLNQARIPFPPELHYDPYRLGRYLFRRWADPAVRQAFLQQGIAPTFEGVERLKRKRDLAGLRSPMNHVGAPAVMHLLRRLGLADLIGPLIDSFTPEEAARYRALLLHGKVTLHRFLTEPEPARTPSAWEQRKLALRVRLRDVQLHSMRRSLHRLRRERKALLDRLRDLSRADHSEVDALAAELAQLRAQVVAAEQHHKAALEEQAARHRGLLDQLRADLARVRRDCREMLAVRRAWLRPVRG